MIQCPKCQAELTESDLFCFVCGHKIEQQTLPQKNAQEGAIGLFPCPNCQNVPSTEKDLFCAECGAKLNKKETQAIKIHQVEIPKTDSSLEIITTVEKSIISVPDKEEPVAEPQYSELNTIKQTDVQQQPPVMPTMQTQTKPPVQNAAAGVHPTVFKKKRKAGKMIFTIFLVFIMLCLLAGAIFGVLIYNGNIPRRTVGQYVPKSILDIIPAGKGSKTATASRYFVVYCFGQFEKQNTKKDGKPETEKQAVISDIFTNVDAGSETNDKAEIVFRNAGNEQIQKFSRFSKFFVTSFSTNLEALTERENIINDLKSKGYKPEFVRVVK